MRTQCTPKGAARNSFGARREGPLPCPSWSKWCSQATGTGTCPGPPRASSRSAPTANTDVRAPAVPRERRVPGRTRAARCPPSPGVAARRDPGRTDLSAPCLTEPLASRAMRTPVGARPPSTTSYPSRREAGCMTGTSRRSTARCTAVDSTRLTLQGSRLRSPRRLVRLA